MNECFVNGCDNKTETEFCYRCIKSGGVDLQIENNFKYHTPKEGQPEKYTAIREKVKELAYLIEQECPASREKSVAMTNLETAVMWANASIARNE